MEFSKVIFDSCIFIAFYNSDDLFHKEAKEILELYKNNIIIVSSYVIQEVATVLTYRFGKDKADLFIDDILNSDNTIISSSDIIEESRYFKSIKSKISYTDISLLYLAERNKCVLITFDKQLLNLYKKNKT
ncbi:MAG: type II toxin-antitoxin system VapC family toxin [Candidatus Gracilibacteria bacterium]|nr:type II toxin-antitoxin system VapC family toxin [Candidatus Gracilibacteria bacterium]